MADEKPLEVTVNLSFVDFLFVCGILGIIVGSLVRIGDALYALVKILEATK